MNAKTGGEYGRNKKSVERKKRGKVNVRKAQNWLSVDIERGREWEREKERECQQ